MTEKDQISNDYNRIEEIRSDEVQDILSHIPNWITRWGTTLIFIIIIMLLIISWFVKFPDTIQGEITITTEEPLIRLVSKTDGHIEKLYSADKTEVKKGQIIAEITNPTNQATISYLKKLMANPKPSIIDTSLILGDLQVSFNNWVEYQKEYDNFMNNKFQKRNFDNLKRQIEYNNQLASIAKNELILLNDELTNAKEKFHSDSLLYVDNIISKNEFFQNQSEFISKKKLLSNTMKSHIQYKITVSDYEKQLNELQKNHAHQKSLLETKINASKNVISSYIKNWQQTYAITSPINGQLSHLAPVKENQLIAQQAPLFAVIPENNFYIGYMKIPSKGYGNVKIGQRVNIKLDNYPYQEYGQLIGEIQDLSLVSVPLNGEKEKRNEYLVEIKIPKSLITTYLKEIEYSPEMSGSAEIITEDLRVIQRIFNQVRKVID